MQDQEHSRPGRRRVVAVNLLGVVHGSRATVEVMRPRGSGHILNVGSLASWVPVPGETIYAATNAPLRRYPVAGTAGTGRGGREGTR
ncbi:Short-chain dehydrogenase/reductase SDR [Carbonactinospora thermoautotrophica]|uniref:Short-chain dehydrogenase/reductase SDR n=1 Tax=Carbonactinospora thermoautotrophica TaxID=1469144 RepID=A0A132MSS3_9ACTN|nr:SDR family NAD(P)-dependent oxidoreductase [Carbonactinospora thermoautotrophica]KWX00786.1 Short-chain dehydrogenase/reductase SDR [Carbonactinospora thermoautotrophica]